MTTSTQLATGLGGAIGCDYLRSRNQLYFVEYNGKISRLNLLRPISKVVFGGTATMPADSSLNLMDGTSARGGQIRWDHTDPSGGRVMRPQGTCMLAYLGVVGFNTVSCAELQNLTYSQDSLHGDPGSNNQMVNGAMFGVYNWDPSPVNNFDYAKVQVVNYGADVTVRWKSYRVGPRYQILGAGYDRPEDIVISSDEQHAYVTERGGNLLRVDLSKAKRAYATVVSSGMTAPHQIALDEDHNHAYVVEFARPGRLLRIDLTTGAQTALVSDLDGAIGLLVTADRCFACVSEQTSGSGGRVSRIDLNTGQRDVLVTGMTQPFFLTWADPSEETILTTERDPANRVALIDLTQTPASVSRLPTAVPPRPSSVAVVTQNRWLVCSDSVISQLDLVGYTATDPLLLGIGHIPFDHIVNGYADTTKDPVTGAPEDYFFKVRNAPFGGTLSLMINHDRAFGIGAAYYRVFVDNVVQKQSWNDYIWVGNRFKLQSTDPTGDGFFRVRRPNQLWYNHWLGCRLNTSGLTNGLHTIKVELYTAATPGSLMGGQSHSVQVQIDNRGPTAALHEIIHDGTPVQVCEVVDSGSDEFTFAITAYDPDGHLNNWYLRALWGNNKSATVASASYSGAGLWYGVKPPDPPVPSPAWHATVHTDPSDPTSPIDPTSRRCAHTFYLRVWDRVTNGYSRNIHRSGYHKSITIMLPLP